MDTRTLIGSQERVVAVDALEAVAVQLLGAQAVLQDRLVGRPDIPDHHSLDAFVPTLRATADVGLVLKHLLTTCSTVLHTCYSLRAQVHHRSVG